MLVVVGLSHVARRWKDGAVGRRRQQDDVRLLDELVNDGHDGNSVHVDRCPMVPKPLGVRADDEQRDRGSLDGEQSRRAA